MSFTSFQYILFFLPLVFLLFTLARNLPFAKSPQLVLLLASFVFYANSKPWHLGYLLGSIAVNWMLARWMCRFPEGSSRKRILQMGLVLNIGFLSLFKYVNFFFSSIPYFVHHGIRIPDLQFPLGVSFFTITQIMYLVDCYQDILPAGSLFDHASFVAFFPYLISGPLGRPKRMRHQFPQMNSKAGPGADDISRAMYLFSMGLIKKVVFADAFSKAADYGFGSAKNMSALEAWFFIACYTLQIYFDFSGYSDMAIASARFFGIEVQRNFDAPLKSLSVIEFWTRWHISLSQFITGYLYTPIVKSMGRVTLATSSVATFIAMTIAGLWHGPAWTFVMYGVIYGLALTCNQYWRKKKMPRIPAFISWLMTMFVVEMAMLFFRSDSLTSAMAYLPHLVSLHHPFSIENIRAMNGGGLMVPVFVLIQMLGPVLALVGKSSEQLAHDFKPTTLNCLATVSFTLVAWIFLNSSISKPFVYFAF